MSTRIPDSSDDEGFAPSNLGAAPGTRPTPQLSGTTSRPSGIGGAFLASTTSYASVPNTAPAASIGSTTVSTLDETISATLMRDVRNIGKKLSLVLIPGSSKKDILRDWDLWGPLLLCLSLAVILSISAPADQSSAVFTGIFFIIWAGAGVVTLNSQLLGGKISFFQSVCVLGYCVFPLTLSAFVCQFLSTLWIRAVLVLPAYIWSSVAAVRFLADTGLEHRKILAVYPIFLFYFALAWITLISHPLV